MAGDTTDTNPPSKARGLLDFVRSLSTIILLILLFKGCIFDQYTVPSSSMHPTLQGEGRFFHDDRILVNKWWFGPRVPLTKWFLAEWNAPERWDIVVFQTIQADSEHNVLVKRVVGLPGETVHIENGKLHINGEPTEPPEELGLNLEYTDKVKTSWTDVLAAFLLFVQQDGPIELFNPRTPGFARLAEDVELVRPRVRNVNVNTLERPDMELLLEGVAKESLNLIAELANLQYPALQYGVRPEPEFRQIPEKHYFMLGDNSAASLDSRVYGWVPRHHLLGRAVAIAWPWDRRKDFTGFSKTWYGKMFLYGIPTLIVLGEARHFQLEWRRRRTRKEAKGRTKNPST